MSATVGAALKKIAVALLSNKKIAKGIITIVLAIIVGAAFPIIAVVAMISNDVKVDYHELQKVAVSNMTPEQLDALKKTEALMNKIETEMKAKSYTDDQVLQARILTVVSLSKFAEQNDFVKRLVSCFAAGQTEENLISKINREFGTNIEADEFIKLLSLVNTSATDIVELAIKQIGNEGGRKFWSWYGFPGRVEWCACFVSWLGSQCGYIEEGVFPKYAVCDDGVNFFKSKGGWLDGKKTPSPGMVIFFDWADDGLDGNSDHTGIVEKVENGIVYTIEGNSGDKVCENQYSVGHYEILGYGSYKQHESTASGDAASQAWTYLKSYGYSDSVVAGIIGNMMRECGGDTLDLDWDVVGHFDGNEFYGLCQWCLLYTPSGFKGSSIKEQCEYLHNTIESEFDAYGGNYNGITYQEFLKADTRTAAIAFCCVYERCGDYANEGPRRANNAEKAYNQFHK